MVHQLGCRDERDDQGRMLGEDGESKSGRMRMGGRRDRGWLCGDGSDL